MARLFEVGLDVPLDVEDAAAWYEQQRPGLGAEFADAALRVVLGIRKHGEYVTQPLERLPVGDVRQILFDRFPFRAVFLETATKRIVLRVLHHHRSDAQWRSRI